MKALILGSDGFIGRHMVSALSARGCWNIRCCDVQHAWNAFEIFDMRTERFDLVVHAAARSPHRAAIDGQPRIFAYNSMLDAAMFDWAMRTDQGRVLYFSSSAAYPTVLQQDKSRRKLYETDIEETWAGNPDANYGWTKLTGERMAAAARQAGVPVTVVRPFSGYGEDQGQDWPFGAFVARAKAREDPFTIWGDGSQVRDWIHVDDVVGGALAVAESETELPVNLCTGVGTSMRDLAEMVCAEAGYSPEFVNKLDKPTGVSYRVGESSRMSQFYKPKITLTEGIRRAIGGETNGAV